jgi:hypothetical protein
MTYHLAQVIKFIIKETKDIHANEEKAKHFYAVHWECKLIKSF